MAEAMGQLRDNVVFVGGCATGLLLDDARLMDVRPTEDVDAIVEATTLVAYHQISKQLTARGFRQTMAESTPPFRWFWNQLQLDLMPLDERVLGFANRWYRVGFDEAITIEAAPKLTLRHLSAPNFLATKFEAFKNRGKSDVYASHDLEDIMTIMEGRRAIAEQMLDASAPVQKYVAESVGALLARPVFHNALPGLLSEPNREFVVKARLQRIAEMH